MILWFVGDYSLLPQSVGREKVKCEASGLVTGVCAGLVPHVGKVLCRWCAVFILCPSRDVDAEMLPPLQWTRLGKAGAEPFLCCP